jgi:nucleoside-diphosphate kinase
MIVKPDGVAKKHVGEIVTFLDKNDLEIIGMRMVKLTAAVAGKFYDIHEGKPFYNDLLEYMTSGRVIVIAVQGKDAVEGMRKIIGATNPVEADAGTIRKLYAESIESNAVHGSDSPENGLREVGFFFSEQDLIAVS